MKSGRIVLILILIVSLAVAIYSFPVLANEPPVLDSELIDFSIQEGTSALAFDLDHYFSDPDGDILTYTYSGNVNVEVDIDGSNKVTFSAPLGSVGSENITFTASDGEFTAEDTMTVTVLSAGTGEITIESFSASETVYIDDYGYLIQPLVVTGFVKEDGVGTDDGVLIYIEDSLYEYVKADSSNSGFFKAEVDNLYFEETGTFTVKAVVDRGDGASATQEFTVDYIEQGDGSTARYLVDIEVTPQTLQVEPGEENRFKVRIKNIGNRKDTYDLEIDTNIYIEYWFDFETSVVTLNPDQFKYVYLNVYVPEDASKKTYTIDVRAKGESGDVDRVELEVVKSSSIADIDIGSVRVSPSKVKAGKSETVSIYAPIKFEDVYDNLGGATVTVELYINNRKINSQDIYFEEEGTETVTFYLDIGEEPINNKVGEYDIYLKAIAKADSDKSSTVQLSVEETGGITISVKPHTIEVSEDGIFSTEVTVRNDALTQETVNLRIKDLDVILTPPSITVGSEDTKTVTIEGYIENPEIGEYSTKLVAESSRYSDTSALRLKVSKVKTTGFISFTKNGTIAIAVGVLILVFIFSYYFYTRGEAKITTLAKPPTPIKVTPSVEKIEKIKEAVGELKPEKGEREEIVPEISKISIIPEKTLERKFTTRDAEHVIENLDTLSEEFEKGLKEAKGIKKSLLSLAGKVQERTVKAEKEATEKIEESTKASPKKEKARKVKPMRRSRNNYINSVIKTVLKH